MKIVLLASNPQLYSNQRIISAAEKKGHEIKFVNIQDCYIVLLEKGCAIYTNGGEKLNDTDAVIPRIKPSMTFCGTTVVRQFELMNAYCLNGSHAISKSRDKLHSLQLLCKENINMPITCFSHSIYETKHLIDGVGGAPLIIKLLEGTKGIGVVLAETNKAAESTVNALRSLSAQILVQEYIKESKGRDIRCFVIGDQVVAAMERCAEEGEFRANIHLGGTASITEISEEERQMAIRAAKIIGLDVAGVDIVRSKDGPKILEVNSSPGLEGIEGATGIDVAGQIIDFLEQRVATKKSAAAENLDAETADDQNKISKPLIGSIRVLA